MLIGTVLFDWDGTLFDSADASLRAFQKMFSEFGIQDFTRARHDEIYAPDWYTMYRALDLPRPLWDEADRRWLHHYAGEEPHLVSGAREVIDTLRVRGLRLGVVSSGTRSRIEREIVRLGLEGVFGALVCNEDVARRKPDPEGLRKALLQLGCDGAGCCFVGDTPEDVAMGRAAGMVTVAVAGGYVAGERLALCGADAVIEQIGELVSVLY